MLSNAQEAQLEEPAEKYKLRETLKNLSTRLERAEILLDESARGAAVLPQILSELSRLRVELVSAATKSDHVPISALVSMSRIYNGVIKTLAVVTVVIVMWLTGVRALLPELNQAKRIEAGHL